MKVDGQHYRSVTLADDGWAVEIVDQTRLPHEFRRVRVESLDDAARARMRQQDPAGAAELYERILDTFDGPDPGRGVFEMRLAEAREIASD